MTDKELKNYLIFFKQNVVNLRDSEIHLKIEEYFNKTAFINNIEVLENNGFIVEDKNRDSVYSITDKGNKCLDQINKELEYIAEKERVEFEKSKIDLQLAQKMLKEYPYTKWFARISIFIALVLAILEIIQWKNK
jgi:predicted transcriptional regulator